MRAARRLLVALAALALGSAAGVAQLPELSPEVRAHIDAALPAEARVAPQEPRRVLVFSLALGFRHSSIPHGAYALQRMGEKTGAYTAEVVTDVEALRAENLARFDAVFMNNTTGNPFRDEELRRGFEEFVRGGGGLAGLHSCTDCGYEWSAYGRMIGGYFHGHPWHEEVTIRVEEPTHPVCAAFEGESRFVVTDEIYQFKEPYSRDVSRVLLSLDTLATPMNRGGIARADDDFPVGWVHRYGEGRVFYCSLGHREEIFWNPVVLQHYLDGIQYVLGDLQAEDAPRLPIRLQDVDPVAGIYRMAGESGGETLEIHVFGRGRGAYGAAIFEQGERLGELRAGTADLAEPPVLYPTREAASAGGPTGVEYAVYHGVWDRLPDFGSLEPVATGTCETIGLDVRERDEEFGLRFTGFFRVDEAGAFQFSTASDDGSRLLVNGRRVVDNDGLHGTQSKSGEVELEAGVHALEVTFFERSGGEALRIGMRRVMESNGPGVQFTGNVGDETWTLSVHEGKMRAANAEGRSNHLFRDEAKSATVGTPAPSGAIELLPVLANGTPTLGEWQNQNWQALPDGSMRVTPGTGDNRSVREFGDATIHLEFLIPHEPSKSGQGRGNSGVYIANRYEVQILDSFGLVPGMGDCGSIYGVAVAPTNACLPPLSWQAYDIDYRAPRFAADGTVTELPRLTVRHNGVLLHENVEVPRPTTAAGEGAHGALGPIMLQDHGHPVRYRNVWVLPR